MSSESSVASGLFSHVFDLDGDPAARWDALAGPGASWRGLSEVDGLMFAAAKVTPPAARPGRGFEVWSRRNEPSISASAKACQGDLGGEVDGLWLEAGLHRGTRMLTAGDLALVLAGVDLARTPVQIETDEPLALGAFLLAVADVRGIDFQDLRGGIGADPLATLARSGSLNGGLRGALFEMRATAELFQEYEAIRPVLVSTRTYVEAGATPEDEIAWALATAVAYLRELMKDGSSGDWAASQIRFSTALGPRFFDEVAKLRALRWCWAKVLAASGIEGEAVIHAESSSYGRTIQDPHTNLLRGTAEAFGAIVGGADTVACLPFDSTYPSSTDLARRMARNIPILLGREAHLGAVSDPAAGSYLLEGLTDAYARRAWAAFQAIEGRGGMLAAVRAGELSRRLDALRAGRHTDVDRRVLTQVGVSRFANASETPLERPSVNWRAIEGELGEDFGEGSLKERMAAVEALREATDKGDIPAVASAGSRCGALGIDIMALSGAMHEGNPSFHATPLRAESLSQPWERLRSLIARHATSPRPMPVAVVLGLGAYRDHAAAAMFAHDALAPTGMRATDFSLAEGEPLSVPLADTHKSLGDASIVLIAPGKADPSTVVDVAGALKAAGVRAVAVAGKVPADGPIDVALHEGAPLLEGLTTLLALAGVTTRSSQAPEPVHTPAPQSDRPSSGSGERSGGQP